MNKRQKAILRDFTIVIVATAIAVVAMIIFKDWINRSEATKAMQQLGEVVLNYRKEHGSIPPESYVDQIKQNLEGHARLGSLRYRARWIDFESTPDEILAYSEQNYHSPFFGRGFIVLRLNGTIEWVEKRQFETLLAQQQSQIEKELTRK